MVRSMADYVKYIIPQKRPERRASAGVFTVVIGRSLELVRCRYGNVRPLRAFTPAISAAPMRPERLRS